MSLYAGLPAKWGFVLSTRQRHPEECRAVFQHTMNHSVRPNDTLQTLVPDITAVEGSCLQNKGRLSRFVTLQFLRCRKWLGELSAGTALLLNLHSSANGTTGVLERYYSGTWPGRMYSESSILARWHIFHEREGYLTQKLGKTKERDTRKWDICLFPRQKTYYSCNILGVMAFSLYAQLLLQRELCQCLGT